MYLANKNSKLKILITILFLTIVTNIFAQNTVGLILNDATQSYNGYTLFGPKNSTTTYLIDNDGFLIHQWNSDYKPAATAYLLEDGNLLRATKLVDPNGGSGGFQVLDWDGIVLWGYTYGPQHHDIEPLPNGNVLLVTNDVKANADVIAAGRNPAMLDGDIRSLKIVEIERDNDGGKIVWEWYAWDHIIQEFDNTKDNFGVVADHPELIDLNFTKDGSSDWLHVNSIDYNKDFDQIMVSCRGVNELWIIDHSTTSSDLLYRWGNPIAYQAGTVEDQMLFAQHDARWIKSGLPGVGNIMVFNNGLDRPEGNYSSIDEFVPPVDNLGNYDLTAGSAFEPNTLTWLYTATNPTDMYSSKFSGAQRLPNGNTLICNGVGGELIEVTNSGEIVWRYISPVTPNGFLSQGDEIENNDIFRSHRYGPNYAGFDEKSLTPGVKLNTNNDKAIINEFYLYNNYPNPFNPTTTIAYNVLRREFVTITVFDILGNKLKTLVNQTVEPGQYSIIWDSKDDNGRLLSSGIFFYTIQAGQFNQTKKMILLR